MHDLDRSLAYAPDAMEMKMDESGYERDGEDEFEAYEGVYDEYEADEGVFDETEEMELAAELLSVGSEEELEYFLGRLVKRVARKVRRAVKSPTGRALRGVLKRAAKKVLPVAGGAAGTFFGGPMGGAIGSNLASAGGRALGLELEGLSPEDQEFEVAKRVVRLAGDAAKVAALSPESGDPVRDAKAAVVKAAKQHAPGLVRPPMPVHPGAMAGGVSGHSGKWIRRGRKIVLLGV